MPELIKDVGISPSITGQKNAAIIGAHLFSGDGIAHKTFTDVHYVRGDTNNDTEEQILATLGLVQLGQYTRKGFCVERTARCTDDTAKLWEVKYQFSSDVNTRVQESYFYDSQLDGYRLKRPEEMMPIMRWSTELITEPLLRDQEELDPVTEELMLIQNTVGELLFPDTLRSITILELEQYVIGQYTWHRRLRKFTSTLNDAGPIGTDAYGNDLRMEWFFGAPHACCWCASIRTTETGYLAMYEDIMPEDPNNPGNPYSPHFIKETIQFKFRWWYDYDCDKNAVMPNREKRGWKLQLLNQGNFMKQKKEADETQDEGVPAAGLDRAPGVTKLDADGFPLEVGEPPVWLPFNRYPVRKFSRWSTDIPPYTSLDDEVLVAVKPIEPEIDPIPAEPYNQDFPPILNTPTPGNPCP